MFFLLRGEDLSTLGVCNALALLPRLRVNENV